MLLEINSECLEQYLCLFIKFWNQNFITNNEKSAFFHYFLLAICAYFCFFLCLVCAHQFYIWKIILILLNEEFCKFRFFRTLLVLKILRGGPNLTVFRTPTFLDILIFIKSTNQLCRLKNMRKCSLICLEYSILILAHHSFSITF